MPLTKPWEQTLVDLRATFDKGILRLTIDREPSLNALSYDIIEGLTESILQAAHLDEVRVVAIAGAGDRAFSSGDDMFRMNKIPEPRSQVRFNARTHHAVLIHSMRELRKPVVALIKGYCVGAGFDIALACDFRIAADNVSIGDQRPLRAIPSMAGASWFLPRIVGLGRATDLLMTGRRCNAAEALQIGLVSAVHPLATFDAQAEAFLHALAQMPTFCLGTNKANLNFGLINSLETSLAHEVDRFVVNRRSRDNVEGEASFREKRTPSYTGIPPGPATDDDVPV